MKKPFVILSLAALTLCAAPFHLRAEDAVPPKPPGGDKAPAPSAEKPEAKPEGRPDRGPGGPGGRMNPEERLKMMTEKLGLTAEQQEKIKALQEKNGPELRELMSKGRENMTEADKEKMRELMRTQMEKVGAVLTPEQTEKMKEMRAAGGGPGGERRKREEAK